MTAIALTTRPVDDDNVAESIELFTIDDVAYSIPSKPRVNVALKYLRLARTQGQDMAVGWLLEELLGEAGYTALMDYDDLTVEDLTSVAQAAVKVVLGAMEDATGE